jgi:FAD/FMN-containing dehydrogenase
MAEGPVLASWGGLRWQPTESQTPFSAAEIAPRSGGSLAYGNGRSYGDSCFSAGGTQVDMRRMNRVLSFNPETGVVVCEPGLVLGDLINLVAPQGWFPAVVPGTRHVTIGGAIANDIHGKNHHVHGTFGEHVQALTLMRQDLGTITCSPTENSDYFRATIGGMGLTGIITQVWLQLRRIPSPAILQEVTPLASLSDFFAEAPQAEARHEYCVAWIDSLAKGDALGRGILLAGDHAPIETRPDAITLASPRLFVPFTPPLSPINRWSLSGFNAVYRHVNLRKKTPHVVSCGAFFFPLDAVGHWNRLYGPKGLRQHQSILPMAVAETAVREMLNATHAARQGSFLTVLKLFQKRRAAGLMSFPMEGVTLTLDFPYLGPRTDALLDQLDAITTSAGGRVNPYKDAHMSTSTFNTSFPQITSFRNWIEPGMRSQFSDRVGLT